MNFNFSCFVHNHRLCFLQVWCPTVSALLGHHVILRFDLHYTLSYKVIKKMCNAVGVTQSCHMHFFSFLLVLTHSFYNMHEYTNKTVLVLFLFSRGRSGVILSMELLWTVIISPTDSVIVCVWRGGERDRQ